MIKQNTIEEKVKEILLKEFELKEADIQYNKSFTGDLGMDSLDIVLLFVSLEQAFGIEIPDSETAQTQTVGDLISYLNSKKTKKI